MADKAKTVFLFSGQGSQYAGMGVELVEKYPELKEIFDEASEVLGFDLYDKCANGTDAELAQTVVSQPAIMAVSLAALEAVKKNGIEASAVAGHSLGEYAAMVAAGMISRNDGFKIIKERSEAMQRAAEGSSGAMCAIVGKSAAEIEEVCAGIDGYVVPVNYNSSVQTVIAGETAAVDAAAAKFAEMGARAVKLNVVAAFHSKLMQPAADEFYEKIKGVTFESPKLTMMSNITGKALDSVDGMAERLAKHIVSPVRFTDELANLEAMGYDTFIELGPNKVLTGLVKKTLKGVTAVNVENAKTLEKALGE
ncbi:MAG: ACP S-malonyltransferase [Huintestinicola sp.]